MFGWDDIAAQGLKAFDGVVTAYNNWQKRREKLEDQNTGRKLQNADSLAASVKGDSDAQKVRDDVDGLTHQQLVDELRGPTAATTDKR